jgi:threonine synthase
VSIPTTTASNPAIQRCIEDECGATYGINERLYVCRLCGGLLDVLKQNHGDHAMLAGVWEARLASFNPADRSGVWRYRELLPFADDAPIVTLQEGNTPLYDAPRTASYCGLEALQLKHQGCNPTGSFKDTGMTTAVTQARILGARIVVCASTGNTAASLAAYAARAGLRCAILVPSGQVSTNKLAQSLDFGAAVLEIDGNFDECMRVIRELSEDESIYLVNSINPFRIEGQKTVAAELLQQCDWRAPDHVVVPGGNLGNSTAFGKGFTELLGLGLIDRLPRLSVVQAEGSAPFAKYFADLSSGKPGSLSPVLDPETLATAIKIGAPVSWKKSIRGIVATGGHVLSVTEQEIADAKAMVGRDGIGCEPASATTVAGIKRMVESGRIKRGERVVAVLTGNVLKDTDYIIKYHRDELYSTSGESKEKHLITSTFANKPVRVQATKTAILNALMD